MKKITVSAPGKLMLLGEHVVVYGHPCLVTAVNQRMKVTIEMIDAPEFWLEAPDVQVHDYKKPMDEIGSSDIPKGAKFVEIAVKNFLEFVGHPERSEGSLKKILPSKRTSLFERARSTQNDRAGLRITTSSEFSSQFGFGSSSASTVCVVKALSELFALQLSQKELFDLAYKTVLDIQGKGSGFDVAAAVFGGTLYFVTAGKEITHLSLSELPLIVGYSGIKADTVTLMNQVKEKFADSPQRLAKIYSEIERIVDRAREAMVIKDWKTVGGCMEENQTFLQELGVSIPKLDAMITGAQKAGAYGAKLSGAGGGDCMIALVPREQKNAVTEAIVRAGGEVIPVVANAEGVKVE